MSQHAPDARWDRFTAQTWKDQERVHDDLAGLSIEAAREITLTHAQLGYTGRILSEDRDYCEVYTPDGQIRRGTFAETTLVRVEG